VQLEADPGSQVILKDTLLNKAVLKLYVRLLKSRKLSTSTSLDRTNRACEVPIQFQSA
jgi:hypothetical protein